MEYPSISEIMKIFDKNIFNHIQIDEEESWCLEKIEATKFMVVLEMLVHILKIDCRVNFFTNSIEIA